MAKSYYIDCKDVGVDCEYAAQGSSIEEVIERCAEHGRSQHGMHSFDPSFYAKMRKCIRIVEDSSGQQHASPR